MIELLIQVLATWRLTSLLGREDGPFEMFAKMRDLAGIKYNEQSYPYSNNVVGKMLLCFLCTSIWAAILVVLLTGPFTLIQILAVSGGAIFMDKLIRRIDE